LVWYNEVIKLQNLSAEQKFIEIQFVIFRF
jgi:hypothetical protein